jgi:hypothetical protein
MACPMPVVLPVTSAVLPRMAGQMRYALTRGYRVFYTLYVQASNG